MESTTVVIVGAGPSGLALALSLARYNVHSIILEKGIEIEEDPRGVFLAGDAVRVLWQLGISERFNQIGHNLQRLSFHKGTFMNEPFFNINLNVDKVNQTVPVGIMQVQPKFEYAMRNLIEMSSYCQMRVGCEVVSRVEAVDGVVVGYKDHKGELKHIRGQWLVGADGKKGVVRKHFLEESAGIKQGPGLFHYEGTWIAANLRIKLPTPESHPEFPLWKIGFTPERVYDLFWPKHWHFCCPPAKPTACGRFGPCEDRLWRHEFVESDWYDGKDSEALLWEHITPMITRKEDESRVQFDAGEVVFPRDCIEVMRCRPFTFTYKIVNKWFNNRTILIGDAAHVFPPFGGQGLATGIRDGEGLAWRLAMFNSLRNIPKEVQDKILTSWAHERRKSIDYSAMLTIQNGELCNKEETWSFFFFRKFLSIYEKLPFVPNISVNDTNMGMIGYREVQDGFFLSRYGGGGKMAQIWLQVAEPDVQQEKRVLSDALFKRSTTIMSLLIIDQASKDVANVKDMLMKVDFPASVLGDDSLLIFNLAQSPASYAVNTSSLSVCYPTPVKLLGDGDIFAGYNAGAFRARLGPLTKFAIIRPDNIIVALAKNLRELNECLHNLKSRLT